MTLSVTGAVISGGLSFLSSRSASKEAARQSEAANEAARMQAQIAKEQWETWKNDYQPLERGMVADAQNYDTPERREEAAAQALGDVNMQYAKQKESLGSRLASFGIDPSSAKYASAFGRLGGQQGAASAGAMNMSRSMVGDTAWQRKLAMAGIGRNLAGSANMGLSSAAANLSALAGQSNSMAGQQAAGAGNFIAPIMNGIGNYFGNKPPQWSTVPTLTPPTMPTVIPFNG